jgi:hypothetical protein
MSWIKLETHIFDKLEIFEIAEELNIDPDSVVGKCCRIWSWFDLNTTNGVTPSVTESLLDRYCGIKGFCNAMLKAGWMEKDGKNLYLPNFDRHNSQSAKDRALTAKRVSKHRKNKISNDECNAISNDEPLHESLDREDKIREDEIREDKSNTILVESKIPPCPHQEIISIYHNTLPELPKVLSWNKTREGYLKQRWRQLFVEFECKSAEEGLDWFKNDFFQFVRDSKFLMGKVQSKDRNTFLADLEWMIKPTNFTKIIERKYEN